ncbi:MAG: hypothetical protein FWC68_06675, partial [Oscillospiraceae bacterium]|nr:hypothetical protein [Oscillospiraceae bacterium]
MNEIKKKIENFSFDSQIGMYFSNKEILDNGIIMRSNTIEDKAWNFYTQFKANTKEEFYNSFEIAKKELEKR